MKILIADDDRNLRKILMNELSEEGYLVDESDSGFKTIDLLEDNDYDIVILDLNMPSLGGMEVLKKIRTLELSTEVIILTGNATVSTAVEAMKLGAYDYLTKPFKLEELKAVIEKAYEKKKLLGENLLLKTQLKMQSEQKNIITNSNLMIEILESVKKIAKSDFPVLICGESGVGKELIAKAIHDASAFSEGPFIPINCGAIPETMLESELFGHEKGAFTGAHVKKLGLIEIANNGTLFLDEIGELASQLQVKLLRVIETGSFLRVGGVKEIKVNVRFISATNRDLKSDAEKTVFRTDLFYRISALTINIPPLRERREDIPLLVNHFIKSDASFRNKRFDKDALRILSEYSWPGNVRELQNMVHRILLLSPNDIIDRNDLPADLMTDQGATGRKLEDIERNHIVRILREVGGQKGKAAEILGIDPKTLYRKLSGYGIKG